MGQHLATDEYIFFELFTVLTLEHYYRVLRTRPSDFFTVELLLCRIEEYASTLGSRRFMNFQKKIGFISTRSHEVKKIKIKIFGGEGPQSPGIVN